VYMHAAHVCDPTRTAVEGPCSRDLFCGVVRPSGKVRGTAWATEGPCAAESRAPEPAREAPGVDETAMTWQHMGLVGSGAAGVRADGPHSRAGRSVEVKACRGVARMHAPATAPVASLVAPAPQAMRLVFEDDGTPMVVQRSVCCGEEHTRSVRGLGGGQRSGSDSAGSVAQVRGAPARAKGVPMGLGDPVYHPSWLARRAAQAQLAAVPEGKHVVFGNDGSAAEHVADVHKAGGAAGSEEGARGSRRGATTKLLSWPVASGSAASHGHRSTARAQRRVLVDLEESGGRGVAAGHGREQLQGAPRTWRPVGSVHEAREQAAGAKHGCAQEGRTGAEQGFRRRFRETCPAAAGSRVKNAHLEVAQVEAMHPSWVAAQLRRKSEAARAAMAGAVVRSKVVFED
jgi:hypothetical protein